MKICVLLLGIVVTACNVARAQPSTPDELFEALVKGPEQARALETVLKNPGEYSAFVLVVGAGAAMKANRLEDAAFLFYASQMRARFDEQCFPPKGKGGDSPFLVYALISQQAGAAINPAIMAEPKKFEKVLARVTAFTPEVSKDYSSGYEFTERKAEMDGLEAFKAGREEYLKYMQDNSILLNDQEYFTASQVVRAYNLGMGEKRPTEKAKDEAMETMRRIEKTKGLKGFVGS